MGQNFKSEKSLGEKICCEFSQRVLSELESRGLSLSDEQKRIFCETFSSHIQVICCEKTKEKSPEISKSLALKHLLHRENGMNFLNAVDNYLRYNSSTYFKEVEETEGSIVSKYAAVFLSLGPGKGRPS